MPERLPHGSLVGILYAAPSDDRPCDSAEPSHAVRSTLARHGGHELDGARAGLLARFPGPAQAVTCAVEIQEELGRCAEVRSSAQRVRVGAGVHAAHAKDGLRLDARDIEVAEHLQRLAGPGGVCISAAALAAVEGKLPFAFESAGEHRIRPRTEPVAAYRVVLARMLRFGEFELDLERRQLWRRGIAVELQRRPLELLALLARQRGRFVSKQEILDAVWPDTSVSEAALFSALRDLRRALGDDGRAQTWIRTGRGRGFRLVVPERTSTPVATGPPRDVESHPALVGRDDFVALLQGALDEACRGRGRVVLLAGESGIGKTRLAQEIARRAEGRGVRVLWGRCGDGAAAPPYRPWVRILRAALADLSVEQLARRFPAQAPWIAHVLPELRAMAGETAVAGDASDARSLLFDAVIDVLRSVADASPLVVVLDDLHASDRGSLELLRWLAMQIGDARLLVVATYRDTEPDLGPGHPLRALLPDLLREERVTRCGLHGLDLEATALLIAALTRRDADPLVTERLHARTGGNPLYLEEALREPGVSAQEAAGSATGTDAVPMRAELRRLLERRSASLGEPCRMLLRVASVIGTEFDRAWLASVDTLHGAPIDALLDRACAARLLVEDASRRHTVRFRHPLIRDAIYAGLTTEQARSLHRAVGEALEAAGGSEEAPIAALAHHFARAGNAGFEKAFSYAAQAARAAQRALAYEDAATHFGSALALQERAGVADAKIRCELLLGLAEAERRGPEPARAHEPGARAADLARALEAPELLARAALGLESTRWIVEPEARTAFVPLLEEALEALPIADVALRVELLARLAYARAWAGLDGADTAAAEAVAIARRSGDGAALAVALGARHYAMSRPERFAERCGVAREMAAVAREPLDAALAHQWLCLDSLQAGDLPGAEQALAAARTSAELHRVEWRSGMLELVGGQLALLQGRFDVAERAASVALREAERVRNGSLRNGAAALLVGARFLQGRLGELLPFLEAQGLTEFEPVRLLALHDAGRAREAREGFAALIATRLVDGSPPSQPIRLALLADLCGRLGDADAAAVLERELRPYIPQNMVVPAPAFAGSSLHWMGVLADVRGRSEEAVDFFEQALGRYRELEALPWIAWTEAAMARALRRRGRPGDDAAAAACADEAHATARRLALSGIAARLGRPVGELASRHSENP